MQKYLFIGLGERFYPAIVPPGEGSLTGIPGGACVREFDEPTGDPEVDAGLLLAPTDGLWLPVPDDYVPPIQPEPAAEPPSGGEPADPPAVIEPTVTPDPGTEPEPVHTQEIWA